MERLARAILLCQELRENSFDSEAADKAIESGKYYNGKDFYGLSLEQAASKAAGIVGFDTRGTLPIYLLNKCCWNDIQNWAESYNK